jgi:hypothetical protein
MYCAGIDFVAITSTFSIGASFRVRPGSATGLLLIGAVVEVGRGVGVVEGGAGSVGATGGVEAGAPADGGLEAEPPSVIAAVEVPTGSGSAGVGADDVGVEVEVSEIPEDPTVSSQATASVAVSATAARKASGRSRRVSMPVRRRTASMGSR